MSFRAVYLVGIACGLAMITLDIIFLRKTPFFLPLIIIGLGVASLQFWLDFFAENKRQKIVEAQFLEFVRALSEAVKSGISIPKAISNASKHEYGPLNPYVRKLANQLEWGIPVEKALTTFATDTKNSVIKRSVSIIIEAEQSGGDIRDILVSVVDSVLAIKKIKEERKASVYNQIVQGYIVYFLFIGIMIFLQVWLFPKLTSLTGSGLTGAASLASNFDFNSIFLALILIQGFFAGLMIGKFSTGQLRDGILHSLVLMFISSLIITFFRNISIFPA